MITLNLGQYKRGLNDKPLNISHSPKNNSIKNQKMFIRNSVSIDEVTPRVNTFLKNEIEQLKELTVPPVSLNIPIVLVVCFQSGIEFQTDEVFQHINKERQKEQIRTFLGTLIMYSKSINWRIVILTENKKVFSEILDLFKLWPSFYKERLIIENKLINLPEKAIKLRKKWRPCAWTKQFLADMLLDLDSIVYFDTDIIFLGPAEDIWDLWNEIDNNESLLLGPETMYVVQDLDRPRAGKVGLNTGIMLMNLTRLREHENIGLGSKLVQEIEHMNPPPRHDQDVLNSYLQKRPELFLEFSPRFSFYDACCYRECPVCETCESDGILILHGADALFYRKESDPRTKVT